MQGMVGGIKLHTSASAGPPADVPLLPAGVKAALAVLLLGGSGTLDWHSFIEQN